MMYISNLKGFRVLSGFLAMMEDRAYWVFGMEEISCFNVALIFLHCDIYHFPEVSKFKKKQRRLVRYRS